MGKMSNSLNLSLTDELKKFIYNQSGEGTLFSTPSEYVRDLIRHEKERRQAANFRNGVVDRVSGCHSWADNQIFWRLEKFQSR